MLTENVKACQNMIMGHLTFYGDNNQKWWYTFGNGNEAAGR